MYSVHLTEFQQHGLPHLHLALKVEKKPKTPKEVDSVTSGEVPSNDRNLLQLINKFTINWHRSDECHRTDAQKKLQTNQYGWQCRANLRLKKEVFGSVHGCEHNQFSTVTLFETQQNFDYLSVLVFELPQSPKGKMNL